MNIAKLRLIGVAAITAAMALVPIAPAAAAGSGLDGTITDKVTGVPVAGAGIVIQHQDGSGWNFANSDANGHFEFPTASGQYTVQIMANGYVGEWLWGHANSWEADLITAPGTIQVPIMPIQYGAVGGRVITPQGNGIKDVFVQLYRNGNTVESTGTGPSGKYRFDHVETGGGYTMYFKFPSGQEMWYDNAADSWSATPFDVTVNNTTVVNATRPPSGNLSIKAVDKVTGTMINNYCFYYQGGPVQFYTICTGTDGVATLRNITAGSYEGGGYDPNEVYVNGHFGPVTVNERATTTVTVPLEKSVSLHVDFVDAVTGDPVDGACALMADPVRTDTGLGGSCGPQVDYKNLFASDKFRLFVSPYDHVHGAQWVSVTGGGTGDPAQAKVFAPAPGDQLRVTVKLDGAGNVAGLVKDAVTGAGVDGVCPAATGPGASYNPTTNADCTYSDGRYFIRELGPYQWKLAFPDFSGQHAWTWSGDKVNRAEAVAVQVVAGETVNLDVSMPATGVITGTWTPPAGHCTQCVSIYAVDAATGDYAGISPYISSTGAFSMKGLNTQDVWLYYSYGDTLVKYPTLQHTTAGGTITVNLP